MKKISNNLPGFLLIVILFTGKINAQLSGTYSIPGSYSSIAAAITDLNTLGVSGPVVINIAAAYTEVAIVGGYTLNTITGASPINQITFQKAGPGANPIVYAYTGTATPASVTQDGVWRFSGSDYITIDGIDISDPNTTNPATMEFGYGFFKASVTNGCQNNTIKNCVITLNRVNNVTSTAQSGDGSRGIDLVNATSGAHATGLTITSAAGANSNNKFYSNTIQNCNIGISLFGFIDSSPFSFADTGNDIGGTSSTTGNNIINFGGGGTTSASSGILTLAQYGLNVSYNTINNNNGSGVNHIQTLKGIVINAAASANVSITNNTITVNSGGTSQALTGIENNAGSTPTTNSVIINNNLITGCTYTGATSASFNGIINFGSSSYVSISNNIFSNNSIAGTTSTGGFINNSGSATSVININNNSGTANSLIFTGATSGSFNFIYNASGASTATLNIIGNNVQGIVYAVTASGVPVFIYNGAATITQNINNNIFTNLILNTTGGVTFISNSVSVPAASTQNINGNSIVTAFNKTGAGGTITFYTTNASSSAGSICNNTNNNFSNITLTGATTMAGWVNTDGGSPTKNISANTFTNWVCGTSAATCISNNFSGPNTTISSNTISGITSAGAITGITLGTSNSGSLQTISNNVISNLSSITTGGAIVGINIGAATITSLNINNNTIGSFSTVGASLVSGITNALGNTTNIFKNKIYDLQSNNASGTVNGMRLTSGTQTIYNNLVGDLRTPSANAANPLIGINLTGGTTMNVYYNTVYLNGTSSGAQFGSSAILANVTPNTLMRNNVLVNTSTAVGTGSTVAYRRSATTLGTYATLSNNNLFYAGTPSANNLIFNDGTNSFQTLAAFRTFVGTRDASSITENPTFVSTTGSTANFLNINLATPTQIESEGAPVIGITDDYAGTVRNALTPDIGAWEGTFVINDLTPPSLITSNFITPVCGLSGRTFTASFSDASGLATGLLTPRMYYKINAGAYTSVSGTLTSGTFTSGVWTFSLVYSASLNDVISYFVVAQDAFATPNLVAFPGTGFSGTDVNTISTNPTTPNSYVVNSLNGVYTVGAAGTFTSLTAASIAYNTYCMAGPVTFSLTDVLYSTSEVFPIVFKNNVQASASNSLLIIPASGVSVVITPTAASLSSIIKFLDARYITVDGLNTSGRSLNINNSVASAAVANIWLASSNTLGGGNNFITIKNTAVNGQSNSSSNGVISSIDGTLPTTTGGADNDNITISTNTFLVVYNGILANGSATVSIGGLDNWLVTNNIFGPAAPTTTGNIGNGIFLNSGLGFAITSNTVQNFNTSSNGGITLASSSNYSITANSIQNYTTGTTNFSGGIFVSTGFNFILNNNIIQNGRSGYYGGGILIAGATTFTVAANAVSNLTTTAAGNYHGLNINSSNTGFSISQNTITNMVTGSTSSYGTAAMSGMYFGSAVTNGTVNLNQINTITNNSSSGYGARGMMLNTSATSSLTIRNNFISDIFTYSDPSNSFWPICLALEGTTGGVNIYNNTFNLFGTHAGLTSATGSTPLYIGSTGGNLAIMNNILSNTYDNNSSSLEINYSIYSSVAASNFSVIDYNNYFVGGAASSLMLGYLGSAQTTLYGLQNVFGFGQNLHSLNFQPQFTSSTDLHLLASSVSNAGINNSGLTLAGVTIDIDGQTRSLTTPDIGADEFTATGTCTSAVGGTMPVTSGTLCTTQTVLATPSGISSGLGTTYQWKVGTTAGGPYANITTGTGTSSPTYFSIASGFAPGVYYVVFQASCASPVLTGISNEATVTIIASPTVNIASTSSLICQGNSATLTASGTSTSYVWSTSATTPTISISPTATTPYTVTGTNGVCSISNTINILYSVNPTVNVVSASPTVCSNVSATLTVSGATTYSWSNGSTVAVINPTQTATTGYTVAGYNANGCVSSPVSAIISVNQSPTVTISGSSGLCTGQTATLTASGAASYLWSTLSTATTITDAPTTNTVYFVTGTNSLACSSTVSQSIAVASSLSISISGATAVCSGKSATLTASGGVTYLWYDGSITSTIAPTPTANATYSVIGSSGSCSNSAVFTVTMNPNPVIAVAGNATVCSGKPTTFTATGASTYSWTSGVNTSTATVSPLTNTTYVVIGTSSVGCSSNLTVAVTTNSLPIISVAQTATGVCLTSSMTFTASGASSYTWTGGPINASYTVTPTASAVYTVTGTNAAGCISSKTVGLTSYSLPVFGIAPASATVCSLSQVTFTASGASTYTWIGAAIPGATVSYTPAASTVYTVTGTSSQSCVASGTVGVTTNTLPIITITPPSATVCSQSAAGFTASGASTYNWNNTYFTAIFSAAPVTNSTYTLTGNSSQGCSKTVTVGVVALPLPTVVVSPALSTVCINSTNIYTVSGALSYTWANSTTATTIAITPTNNSVYSVTGSDINGCTSVGSAVIITNPLPVLTISPTTATVCPNAVVNFTAAGANTYSWSNGITTASVVITPSVSGIYTVTGIDANSCSGTQTLALTTKTVPVISITPSSSSVCLNTTGTFSANGAVSYTWSSGTQGAGISVSPSVTTVYTVTGKNGIGCTATATANLNIWQPPVINITANATTVCAKESITLTASGASTYTWYPFNVTGATFTNNPTNTIPYSVVAVDANGCSNSDTLTVYVNKCTGIKNNSTLDTRISIYPNPSTGLINASFGFEGSKEILVLNSVGALVMKAFTEELNTTIDLSGYAKGVYFIRVQTNGDSNNYKIVIQ